MYSSTLSLPSALVEGRCSTRRSGPVYPRQRGPVPITQEAGWAARSNRTRKQWLSRHLLDLTAVGK
jgi:hypothetical protein